MFWSEMNPFPTIVVKRRMLATLLPVLVAAPVMAQSDSVRARPVSTWQKDVDQMRQELAQQRRMELELYRMLSGIETRRLAAADSQRTDLMAQSRLVFSRLKESASEQVRLRNQLESMCGEVQKPEGWLGVATTGMQIVDRNVDGTHVARFFLEPPVVASVDPGSPADRVGMRAGDELIEIGGKRLLRSNVVFAELLRPGELVIVKLRRGSEIVTLSPKIEPMPEVAMATPCTWVDAGAAYEMSPLPAQIRIAPTTTGTGFSYSYVRPRIDSSATGVLTAVPSPAGGVYAGPMTQLFGTSASLLAGLQLMALNQESGRAFGVAHGLFVNQVAPGTPGRAAGLRGGDVLVTADSIELRTVAALARVINRSNTRSVSLVIRRGGKAETVRLRW
jgi:C-terminal processing protease CtpA/Prc